MRGWWAMAAAAAFWPGTTLAAEDPSPRIVVTGTGTVSTPPDRATIEFRVVGEGATSDAAVSAMVDKRGRIAAALAALDPRLQARAGEVAVAAVRSPECRVEDQPRLSTGACAIVGYVATIQLTIHTPAVQQAATAVGLIGRNEGSDAKLSGLDLADLGTAQRRAVAAALADAHGKATAIAQASGVSLGRLLSVSSTGYGGAGTEDVIVTGARLRVVSAPPPIVVDLAPRPIETRAQVTVTYAIAP